jgi:hypothetical protein
MGPLGNHYQVHHFSPIEKAVPRPRKLSRRPACENFESGLIQRKNECLGFTEMDAAFSDRAPRNHVSSGGGQDPLETTAAMDRVWERFNQAAVDLEKERKALYAQAEKEIVQLALAISKKIMDREASVHPEIILGVVRKALQKSKETKPIRIRIHPLDLEMLQKAEQNTACLKTDFGGIKFITDELLVRGDCLIETPKESVDAGIRGQLAFIEKAFAALGNTILDGDIP